MEPKAYVHLVGYTFGLAGLAMLDGALRQGLAAVSHLAIFGALMSREERRA